MLRVIKWAYNLGVRNERHRIATYLSSAQGQKYDAMRVFDEEMRNDPVRSNKDAKKRSIEKRIQQKAVDREVVNIIDSIFHSQEKYVRGESVMFPDGEDNAAR